MVAHGTKHKPAHTKCLIEVFFGFNKMFHEVRECLFKRKWYQELIIKCKSKIASILNFLFKLNKIHFKLMDLTRGLWR